MRFYLSRWVGDGTEDNPYRPEVDDESWAAIDLRPDPTVQAGGVLVATRDPAATLPRGSLDLGDDLDARSTVIRDALGTALSVTFEQDTLRGLIAELLILHGTANHDRTRWNRLKENRLGRHRIVMLGETIYDAPVIRGATITESFDQTDSTVLGPDLTWVETEGNWETVSNRAEAVAVTATAQAAHDLDSDDHYVEAEAWGSALHQIGVATRIADANNFYIGYWRGVSDDYRILKRVAGTYTLLADTAGPASISGVVLRLENDGSALELLVDAVSTLSTTDTSLTGTLRCGLFGGGSVGGQLDNFEAGDLAAAGTTVTPAVISLTTTVPTPAIAAAVRVTPAVINLGVDVNAVTVTAAAVVKPDEIAVVTTIPTPTVGATAAATVNPAAIAATLLVPGPTAKGGVTVNPATMTAIVTVHAVTVTGHLIIIGAARNPLRFYRNPDSPTLALVPASRSVPRGFTDLDACSGIFIANAGNEIEIMAAMQSVWATHSGSATATLAAAINQRLQDLGYRGPSGRSLV